MQKTEPGEYTPWIYSLSLPPAPTGTTHHQNQPDASDKMPVYAACKDQPSEAQQDI